ncbi:MAG TPA: FG-GAP-like repeat-containing protein [Gaiellaceae bacterium]|jgi:hypothetical protein|nr:FG-GAP-like repeat-containing protein [Gaiellaceae bacterium]
MLGFSASVLLVAIATAGGAGLAGSAAPVAARGRALPASPVWGRAVESGTLAGDAFTAELQTVDLNGDGLRDVVIERWIYDRLELDPLTILLNRGGGRFVDVSQTIFDGPPPKMEDFGQLVVADFNGDGRPDIYVLDNGSANPQLNPGHPGQQNHLILSTPDGKLRDATANLPQHRTFTWSAAAADVNGDGTVDIYENNLSCCGDGTHPRLLLNDGTGHFTPSPSTPQGVPRDQFGQDDSQACAFVDVDGDGHPDLVLGATDHTGPSAILKNDGAGNFTPFETLPPQLYTTSGVVIDIRSADINGDGSPDLLLEETQTDPFYVSTRVQVLMNDGHGNFTDETSTRLQPPLPSDVSGSHGRILVEDLNDDGLPDLAVSYKPPDGSSWISDPTPIWINHGGVLVREPGIDQGVPSDLRGPVGFVNGAGPHAFLSVEWHPSDGRSAPRYFIAPQVTPPAAPAHLRAVRTGKHGVHLTWTAVAGADRYEVWLNTRHVATTIETSFNARQPGRYRVRAVNAAGVGPFSVTSR